MVDITVYRGDSHFCSSTFLGIVGAGGIGFELIAALCLISYDQVAAILRTILGYVVVVDMRLSHDHPTWSIWQPEPCARFCRDPKAGSCVRQTTSRQFRRLLPEPQKEDNFAPVMDFTACPPGDLNPHTLASYGF